MNKKKRFHISDALTRGLRDTIQIAESNTDLFRNVVLPLSRVELDPDNPRQLAICLKDVREGIDPMDSQFARKQVELEKLEELAFTIKASGLINPIVVYKSGEMYRVVAGERRSLASILAGKQEIDARVFSEKPKGFELKLIQWIENTAREDLSLAERLDNMRDIVKEYQRQHGSVELTATLIKSITGLSLSQSSYYLAALQAPEDVQCHIQNGNIRNLDKAALISTISSADVRSQAMAACLQGASLKQIKLVISQQKSLHKNKLPLQTEQRGRTTVKIQMGSTAKPQVVKTMVDSILNQSEYNKYLTTFAQVDWMDLRQTTKAFRKLVEILELEMA
ncbi:MAG TPA: ParB/RepB/Spo0J family partition protein [Gammaproteobacteria bacterium]|jgi:ParB family chromosome partitioning protein|nr:ParB/RepB/Spo0J family partition protein [Gammaproteobacteria bacterium]